MPKPSGYWKGHRNGNAIVFGLWFAGSFGYWLLMGLFLGDDPMSRMEMLLFLGPPVATLFIILFFMHCRDNFKIGEQYLERGDTLCAARLFSAAYASLDARAVKRLGDLWRTGVEGKTDLDKSLNAYDKAASVLQLARERRAENRFTGNHPFPRPKAGTAEFHDLVTDLIKSLGELRSMEVIGANEVLARVDMESEADN